jgi:hypothetical protein
MSKPTVIELRPTKPLTSDAHAAGLARVRLDQRWKAFEHPTYLRPRWWDESQGGLPMFLRQQAE